MSTLHLPGGGGIKKRKRIKPIVDAEPVIYCLEGVWRYEDDEIDQSSHDGTIKPLLDYLEQNNYWNIRHRDIATPEELAYYLDYEWNLCRQGSILYIATHGSPGCISLGSRYIYLTNDLLLSAEDDENVSSTDLATLLRKDGPADCTRCHVHFGGCAVMANAEEWVSDFQSKTGAAVVTGFKTDEIGWTDLELPGVLAEVMLFSALSDVNYADGRNYKKRLGQVKDIMKERFDDCDLHISM